MTTDKKMQVTIEISESLYRQLLDLAAMNRKDFQEEVKTALVYWCDDEYKPTNEFQRN